MEPIKAKPLDLSDEEREKLGKELKEKIEKAIADRSDLEDSWEIHEKQWSGRLESEDKLESWQPYININITKEIGNQQCARLVNPIVQQDPPIVAVSKEASLETERQNTERAANDVIDDIELDDVLTHVVHSAQKFRTGFVKVIFAKEEKTIKRWEKGESGDLEELNTTIKIAPGLNARPLFTPNVIFPADSVDIETAEWITEKFRLTEHQREQRIASGDFDDVATDSEGDDSDLDTANNEAKNIDPKDRDVYYEVYLERKGVECIVTIDAGGTVWKAVENPLHRLPRPFLSWPYEPSLDSIWGATSLCRDLEAYHRAISASFTQRLEAAALANAPVTYTNDPILRARHLNRRPYPGEMIGCTTLPKESTWVQTYMTPGFAQLNELEQELYSHALKIAGVNDYNFGNEQIQRPTASGQQILVEEGKQPLYDKLRTLKKFVAQLVDMLFARKEQFSGGTFTYFYKDGEEIKSQQYTVPEALLEGKISIEAKASSASMNESVRKQEMVGLMEQMTSSSQTLDKLISEAAMAVAQNPVLAEVKAAEADAYRELRDRLLKTFKVPQPEKINPDLNSAAMVGMQFQQQMMALQQQAQQAIQQIQGELQRVTQERDQALGGIPPGVPPGPTPGPAGIVPPMGGEPPTPQLPGVPA